jgi:hypothetical protein
MREIRSRLVALFLLMAYGPFLIGQTSQTSRQASANATPEYSFTLERVFPHDTAAYTQRSFVWSFRMLEQERIPQSTIERSLAKGFI